MQSVRLLALTTITIVAVVGPTTEAAVSDLPTLSTACEPKACQRDTDAEKAICGTDGLTYPNRCFLERARCHDPRLQVAKRGACRQPRLCTDWPAYRRQNPAHRFEPTCRADGGYVATQCFPAAGGCWCVTPQGLPLPYTAGRRRADVRCGRRRSAKRRSPGRRGRACRQSDKAKFNNNLINIFHTEWSREHGVARTHDNDTDPIVIQWKFRSLDANNDDVLDKLEYRDLKRVTKKAVKPKRCAKNFVKACDVNGDTFISRQEWGECLTRDGMNDDDSQEGGGGGGGNVDGIGGGVGGGTSDGDGDLDQDYGDALPPQRPLPHVLIGHNYEEDTSEIRDDDPTDCLSDRQTALLDGSQFYVPECTPDGRYEKVQCYKAAGYCFCVHEDTGKNIPGTSVKNGTPKCDQLTNANRPMKGCPDEKKTIFLKELLQFLHTRMSQTTNATKSLNGLPWIDSKEEQAATWSFVVFDKNKNKMLDRNEWKAFKETVGAVKNLKKCGKKLPRYCDINKDRHISMTEWLDCLNVQQAVSTSTSVSSRTGKKNPLSMLMED